MTDITKIFIFRWGVELHTIIDETLTCAPETWTLTKRDRKQLNIFERKVYTVEYQYNEILGTSEINLL